MKSRYDLDIVLPCYNPSDEIIASLPEKFEALQAAYPDKQMRLIVSDDGSTRSFGPAIREALQQSIPGAIITGHTQNRGKGATVRTGIAASDALHTIYTDIDMPYSFASMCEVIDRVFKGWDVVIATRNRSYYSKLTPRRKLMSHGSQFLNRFLLRTHFTDTQGGLKGLSPEARKIMLCTRINGFLFDTEFVTMAAHTKAMRITEVETTLREEIVMSNMPLKVLFRELGNFTRILYRA